MALSFWDKIATQLTGGPNALAEQEAMAEAAQQQSRQQDMSEQPHFSRIMQQAAAEQPAPEATVPEQAQQYQVAQLPFQPQASSSYNSAMNDYLKSLADSQGLQKEGIGSLQKRILELQNAPKRQDGLQRAIMMAADTWGGGGGQFQQAYNEANPELDAKQRQVAITQLEDTLRKSRGDLSDSQISALKAKLGFEEAKMAQAQKGIGQQLPAGQAAELADLGTVKGQVDTMSSEWMNLFGKRGNDLETRLKSKMAGFDPTSKENIYEASRRQYAQTIGVPLEGGKLTEPDFQRYLDNFIPSAFDSKERAQKKAENLRKYADQKQKQRLGAFKAAGYNVGQFQGQQASGLSPQQNARMQELLAKKAAGKLQ